MLSVKKSLIKNITNSHFQVLKELRCFSYDQREILRMNASLQRKINILKMFTDEKMFKYEEPIMSYDKATGNVTIIDPADIKKKRKIINSMDEV